MEYWSIGVLGFGIAHHSTTPSPQSYTTSVFQYSIAPFALDEDRYANHR